MPLPELRLTMGRSALPLVFVWALALGCADTMTRTPIVVAAPGPIVEGTHAEIVLPSRKVLVVSPVSLQQVAPGMTLETTAAPSTAGGTASDVLQTEDYNFALSAAESSLLDNGWKPISQAVLARAARDEKVTGGLTALKTSGGLSALQVAMLLGQSTGADSILMIRAISLERAPKADAVCYEGSEHFLLSTITSFAAHVDVVLISVGDGSIAWTAKGTATSLDASKGLNVTCVRHESFGHILGFFDQFQADKTAALYCYQFGGKPCSRPQDAARIVELAIKSTLEKIPPVSAK